jgi:hypothetical protein
MVGPERCYSTGTTVKRSCFPVSFRCDRLVFTCWVILRKQSLFKQRQHAGIARIASPQPKPRPGTISVDHADARGHENARCTSIRLLDRPCVVDDLLANHGGSGRRSRRRGWCLQNYPTHMRGRVRPGRVLWPGLGVPPPFVRELVHIWSPRHDQVQQQHGTERCRRRHTVGLPNHDRQRSRPELPDGGSSLL